MSNANSKAKRQRKGEMEGDDGGKSDEKPRCMTSSPPAASDANLEVIAKLQKKSEFADDTGGESGEKRTLTFSSLPRSLSPPTAANVGATRAPSKVMTAGAGKRQHKRTRSTLSDASSTSTYKRSIKGGNKRRGGKAKAKAKHQGGSKSKRPTHRPNYSRSEILSTLPSDVTDQIHEVCWVRWHQEPTPVPALILSPFDIKGEVVEMWKDMYHEFRLWKASRSVEAPAVTEDEAAAEGTSTAKEFNFKILVYFYQCGPSEASTAFGLIDRADVIDYRAGVSHGYHRPRGIFRTIERGGVLSRCNKQRLEGIYRILIDAPLEREERGGEMFFPDLVGRDLEAEAERSAPPGTLAGVEMEKGMGPNIEEEIGRCETEVSVESDCPQPSSPPPTQILSPPLFPDRQELEGSGSRKKGQKRRSSSVGGGSATGGRSCDRSSKSQDGSLASSPASPDIPKPPVSDYVHSRNQRSLETSWV